VQRRKAVLNLNIVSRLMRCGGSGHAILSESERSRRIDPRQGGEIRVRRQEEMTEFFLRWPSLILHVGQLMVAARGFEKKH
jgi:hypothetical protein